MGVRVARRALQASCPTTLQTTNYIGIMTRVQNGKASIIKKKSLWEISGGQGCPEGRIYIHNGVGAPIPDSYNLACETAFGLPNISYTVPFRPDVHSRVTDDCELNSNGFRHASRRALNLGQQSHEKVRKWKKKSAYQNHYVVLKWAIFELFVVKTSELTRQIKFLAGELNSK
jgi:hypothetical protein